MMVQPVAELGEGHEAKGWIFAGVNHVMGDEGGGFVGWDAAVLLQPLLLINTLGLEAFEESPARLVTSALLVDALDDALLDGFLDGDGVEGPVKGEVRGARGGVVGRIS